MQPPALFPKYFISSNKLSIYQEITVHFRFSHVLVIFKCEVACCRYFIMVHRMVFALRILSLSLSMLFSHVTHVVSCISISLFWLTPQCIHRSIRVQGHPQLHREFTASLNYIGVLKRREDKVIKGHPWLHRGISQDYRRQ